MEEAAPVSLVLRRDLGLEEGAGTEEGEDEGLPLGGWWGWCWLGSCCLWPLSSASGAAAAAAAATAERLEQSSDEEGDEEDDMDGEEGTGLSMPFTFQALLLLAELLLDRLPPASPPASAAREEEEPAEDSAEDSGGSGALSLWWWACCESECPPLASPVWASSVWSVVSIRPLSGLSGCVAGGYFLVEISQDNLG